MQINWWLSYVQWYIISNRICDNSIVTLFFTINVSTTTYMTTTSINDKPSNDVTLRNVRVNIVAMKKQLVLHILSVCL
jgi:hypothetical protein